MGTESDEERVTFTPSQRNTPLAVYKGFIFQKSQVSKNNFYFICQRRRQGCKASLILRDYDEGARIYSSFEAPKHSHNHEPVSEHILKTKEVALVRLRELVQEAEAGTTGSKLVQILLSEIPQENHCALGCLEHLERRARKWLQERIPPFKKKCEEQEQDVKVNFSQPRRKPISNLKLVDDDGTEIRGATMDDVFSQNPSANIPTDLPAPATTEKLFSTSTFPPTDSMENCCGDDCEMHDFDEHQADDGLSEAPFPKRKSGQQPEACNLIEKLASSYSNFKTLTSIPNASKKTTRKRNDKITGERCCICGDKLVSSEASVCNEETFRKACSYLNVRSESKWFPKDRFRFHSFCGLCSKEIMRIHDLYRKVEEIQAVIIRKVEGVEKRVVDAEIVDNWMEEVSSSTASRFEGFRKQVIINYRNKLKLRRKVREVRKTGQDISEAVPVTTAQMYAVRPALGTVTVDSIRNTQAVSRRERADPKSKKFKQSKSQNSHLEYENESLQDVDDDAQSVASDNEVKFWHDDPQKLQVHDTSPSAVSHGNDDLDDSLEEFGNDDDDLGQDEIDTEYVPEREGFRTGSGTNRRKTIPESSKVKVRKVKETYSPSKPLRKKSSFEFPETILRRDGRMFMQGIEIIKNPPGQYPSRPYSASFSCGACGKVILNLWKARLHICGHHLSMFKCAICSMQFAEPRQLERHMQRQHISPEEVIECSVCGKPFKHEITMKYHMWTHLNEEEKKAPENQKYKSWKLKRGGNPSSFSGGVGAFQSFMCSFCSRTFTQPGNLKRHEITHTETRSFQCQYCGRLCSSRKSLWGHVSICSKKAKGIQMESTKYPCRYCSKQFTSRGAKSRHLRRFHRNGGALPFPCGNNCDKTFATKSACKRHRSVCNSARSSRSLETFELKGQECDGDIKAGASGTCQEHGSVVGYSYPGTSFFPDHAPL